MDIGVLVPGPSWGKERLGRRTPGSPCGAGCQCYVVAQQRGRGRRALFLQPFYRIDRLAVDPQLEIEGGGAGRRPAHRAQDGLVIDMGAALNRQGRKIVRLAVRRALSASACNASTSAWRFSSAACEDLSSARVWRCSVIRYRSSSASADTSR